MPLALFVVSLVLDAHDLLLANLLDPQLADGFDPPRAEPFVLASATGVVTMSEDLGAPRGKIVIIAHRFLDNGKLRTLESVYEGLSTSLVGRGELVRRGQRLGSAHARGGGAGPRFEIRGEEASTFIASHRRLLVPAREEVVLIAVKQRYRLYVCHGGRVTAEHPIALGQEPRGHKARRGDDRTPEGEYVIIQKALGPFGGDYGAYLGSAWMRINYPNDEDARRGAELGLITEAQRRAIARANAAGREPLKTTRLGGGIGIHGWADDFVDDGQQNLTWGCIGMRNEDLRRLYDLVPLHTKLVVHP